MTVLDDLGTLAGAASLDEAVTGLGEVTLRRDGEVHVVPSHDAVDLDGVHTVTLRRPVWRPVTLVAFHLDAGSGVTRAGMSEALGAGVEEPAGLDQVGGRDIAYAVPPGWKLPTGARVVATVTWDDVVQVLTVELPSGRVG